MNSYVRLVEERVSKLKIIEETLFEDLTINDILFLKECGYNYLTEGNNIPYIDPRRLDSNIIAELSKFNLTPEGVEKMFREKITPYFKGKIDISNLYYKSHASANAIERGVIKNLNNIAEVLEQFFKDYSRTLIKKYMVGNLEINIEDNIPSHKEKLHPVIAYDNFGVINQEKHAFRFITITPSTYGPYSKSRSQGYVAAAASVPRSTTPQRITARNGVAYNRDHMTFMM